MSSDTFLKKYTKYWPPKLYVICCLPLLCEALWGKLCQSALKINLTLAFSFFFWSKKLLLRMFCSEAATLHETCRSQYRTRHGGNVTHTLVWWRRAKSDQEADLSISRCISTQWKELPYRPDFKLTDDLLAKDQYIFNIYIKKKDMSNRMFPVKQKILTCVNTVQ